MRRIFAFMVILVLCGVVYAGNTNDMAYLGFEELDTISSVDFADELVVFESDIPKQGATVADVVDLAVPDTEFVSGTSDTLTAADDGKVIVYTAGSNVTVTLPAVSNFEKGVTLVNGDGDSALIIDPDDGDTLYNGVLGLDAGDKISNTGNTGECATIRGSGTSGYVTTTGTWTDGGA